MSRSDEVTAIVTLLVTWWSLLAFVVGVQPVPAATADTNDRCPDSVVSADRLPPPPALDTPPAGPWNVEHAAISDAFLGVGHVRLAPHGGLSHWDWHLEVDIPLFSKPGGNFRGWITSGRTSLLGREGERRVVHFGGLVETGYEQPSIPVLGEESGWLEVWLGPRAEETAWVHRCQLPASVAYERWEELFLRDDISPLFFRTEVPHGLRAGPGVEHRRITWIPSRPSDYDLEPVEVRDDWMRVVLEVPSDYCVGPEAPAPRRLEGWIKWWGRDLGPWVWFSTRGC